MGIPSYFSYIVKNHVSIIKKFENNLLINHLYLDCNSIIYDVVYNIDFTKLIESDIDTIIKAVCVKIDSYISFLKPDTNVYIAFDGVAPVAKLEQQRSRRFKSLYQNNIKKNIMKNITSDPWNTTAITPGTLFMKQLNETIYNYYKNPERYNIKKFIISGSDKYGEGEHKLFQFIRENKEEHSNKNIVIYGLDADLIMLSINHLPIAENIYLFRETPHFIQSINADLEPNESYLLDIPELAKTITKNMNNDIELNIEKHNNCLYDYIFLCFFLGNDFMPHFPALNIRTGGVDKMINAYKETIGGTNENLTDGKNIYWKNVKKLVNFLANNEEVFIKNETKLRDKREKYKLPCEKPEDKLKKIELLPNYERQLEKYINPFKTGWQNRYYECLFDKDDEEHKKEVCINFLEAIEWTMKYYTSGCSNWRWFYRYNYPPLLIDLVKYIPQLETEFIEYKKPNPVNELVQLSYVLPKQSLHLLPEKIHKNLLLKHPEWYQEDNEFVWAYCRYFWESHVELPNININELEEFITNISLS
jgi:5'-3' exonuclease